MLICAGVTMTACFGGNDGDNGDQGEQHVCSYTKEVAEEKYLKSEADCRTKAVYYKSCSCGKVGTATFNYGDYKHVLGDWIEKVPATCTENGTEGHYHCSECNNNYDENYNYLSSTTILAKHNFVDGFCDVCGNEQVSENLNLQLSTDKRYYIVKGIGSCNDSEIAIPSTYNGLPVKAIDREAFSRNSRITSVIIGKNITTIYAEAFYNCKNLERVTIGKKVSAIRNEAFSGCPLTDGVYISDLSAWCNVYFDKSSNPIRGSTKLYLNKELVTDLVISDNITNVSNYAFENYDALTSVAIGNGVKTVGEKAFEYCSNLTNVSIGTNLTSIEKYAFHGCDKLTSVTIRSKAFTINDYAFQSCGALTDVILYGNATISSGLFSGAFAECKKINYTVEDNAYYLGNEENPYLNLVKSELGISTCSINEQCKYICNSAFSGRGSLTSIIIPDSVTTIGSSAFNQCVKLESVVIGKGVTSIGYSAFGECESLVNLTIGTNVKIIEDSAFENCSKLISVIIPDSVTTIERQSFSGCSSLTSVTIGTNVNVIEEGAFSKCVKLVEVINRSALDIVKNNFGNVGSYALNVKTSGESDIVNVDGYLFYTYDNVNYLLGYIGDKTELNLPNNYNNQKYEIYNNAFDNCSKLTKVFIGDGVTIIGEKAFNNCSELTVISLGDNVTRIGNGAFDNCDKLIYREELNCCYLGNSKNEYIALIKVKSTNVISVNIIDGCKIIYSSAFEGCSILKEIEIERSVTFIGGDAFSGCSELNDVTFVSKNGWFVSDNLRATEGTNVNIYDNPSLTNINANYLKSSYRSKYWVRSVD